MAIHMRGVTFVERVCFIWLLFVFLINFSAPLHGQSERGCCSVQKCRSEFTVVI